MGIMLQRLEVDQTYLQGDRLDFFRPFLENKKVLHVGFVDWPITRKNKSLHLTIAPWCQRLDGVDVHAEKADHLKVPNGNLYFDWTQVPNDYDTILVPEVIEHVDNIQQFFETLNKFKGTLIVTAPDAFLLYHSHFNVVKHKLTQSPNEFVEIVHPDHNCWYSPYTLKNTINKFSIKKVQSLHWVMNQSIAAVCY
jgi:hypothetical protein